MREKEFKSDLELGTEIYSIEDNKLATWKIVGICFYDYHRDQYNNLCCRIPNDNKPDIEYVIERYKSKIDTTTVKDIMHCNNINKKYFTIKTELYKSLEEDI
jgi:hypothetical protein